MDIKNLIVDDISFSNSGMVISWSANIGFGQLTVYSSSVSEYEHTYEIDTECMGKDFVQLVLDAAKNYLLSSAKID